MLKHTEESRKDSCWNRADQNEMVFVLLGRDVAAPAAIRAWVEARILAGKNKRDDTQIQAAIQAAASMEGSRR